MSEWCDKHDSQYDIDEGCEYCYNEYKDKKDLIEEFLDDITPEKLHQFYLEAIKLLNSNSYNPNANVPYGQLSEEQKQIDKYIADKLKEKWEKK